METNRKLVNYLPHFMQEYFEMRKVMEAEQPEIDLLWNSAEGVFADQFVTEATENGIARWESMLGVSPKATDTLDERRFRILTLLNQELPYTLRKLEQTLTNLCGADGYFVEVKAAEYHVEVKLALVNESNYGEVKKILYKMIPANLTHVVKIMYNSHAVLANLTHAELSAYMHNQLKREVFE